MLKLKLQDNFVSKFLAFYTGNIEVLELYSYLISSKKMFDYDFKFKR